MLKSQSLSTLAPILAQGFDKLLDQSNGCTKSSLPYNLTILIKTSQVKSHKTHLPSKYLLLGSPQKHLIHAVSFTKCCVLHYKLT